MALLHIQGIAGADTVDENGQVYDYDANGDLYPTGRIDLNMLARAKQQAGIAQTETDARHAKTAAEDKAIADRNNAMRGAAERGQSAIYNPQSGGVDYGSMHYDPVRGTYVTNPEGANPPAVAAPDNTRPWYMNFDDATLQAMIKTRPDLAPTIPPPVMLKWSNDFFLANPQFQSILPAERRATFGTGALSGAPVVQPPGGGSASAGDKTGVVTRGGPSGAGLTEGGVTTPLPPGLAAPITGAKMPTYRNQGNLPTFSSQSLARMTPGERELLGTTVNRTGGRAEDYFDNQRKMFSQPEGSGASYRPRRY